VETAGHIRRRFVGLGECEKVRWRLAMRFPWFEAALAHAQATIWPEPVPPLVAVPSGPAISNDHGRIEAFGPQPAADLLRAFLDAIQHVPMPSFVEGWEILPATNPPKIEHAAWLTAVGLEQIMGSALHRSSLPLTDLHRSDDVVRARLLAFQTSRWVTVTRDERVFDRLVDRVKVIEVIARNCVQSSRSE
jgi:hypothetical protein